MIRISIGRLSKEPVDLEGEEPASLLELEDDPMLQPVGPVAYELHAKLVSGNVLVEGSIHTRVAGSCGRCLQPVECDVVNDHVCIFVEEPAGEEIDITEEVRGEILLELPMNLICSEDCQGLCPGCGVNLNRTTCSCKDEPPAGSPWSALDQLK